MDFIITTLSRILLRVGFLQSLLIIFFVGLLMFWYEARKVHKDRNSIFDHWIFISIIAVFWGRVSYIIAQWSDFSNWYWFWLPYERYGDDIFLFRAMPWRLFSIWDGGFLILAIYVTLLLFGYIFAVIIKRWRWKEMMMVILLPINFMLAFFLLSYGIFIRNDAIIQEGLYFVFFTLGFQLLLLFLEIVYKKSLHKLPKIKQLVSAIYLMFITFIVNFIFLADSISKIEEYHLYFFTIFSLFLLGAYVYDIRKPDEPANLDAYASIRHSITLNQAIKVSDQK
jgi:hypothetical protein